MLHVMHTHTRARTHTHTQTYTHVPHKHMYTQSKPTARHKAKCTVMPIQYCIYNEDTMQKSFKISIYLSTGVVQ